MVIQATVYLIDSDSGERHDLAFRLGALGVEAWPFSTAELFLLSAANLQPKLVLLDLESAPSRGGELIASLQRAGIDWPIIALTRSTEVPLAIAAMKRGFIDLLLKPVDEDQLVGALAVGAELLTSRLRSAEIRRAAEARVATLTPREFSICNGLMAGQPNKIVAYNLGISVRTVEAHRSHIMMKLRVRSIAEVCVLLSQAGVPPGAAEPSLPLNPVRRLSPAFSVPFRASGEMRGAAQMKA